jgi:hypothetical protein
MSGRTNTICAGCEPIMRVWISARPISCPAVTGAPGVMPGAIDVTWM